jgi:hypothetical protein
MGARDRIGAQVAAKNIGESGCYFLSILKAGEALPCQCPDILGYSLGAYWTAIDKGWMGDDCLVTDAGALMSDISGKPYTLHKEPADYQTQPGEIEILRFEVQKTGVTYSHFVLGDGKGGVAWDPWPGSLTVKNGKLQSKRIFSPKGAV